VVESRGNPRSLLSAPWVYAIVAFLLCQRATSAGAEIEGVLKPIAQATYPLLLVVLGASLHPLVSMKDANAWATVCVRLVSGIGVAVLAIAVLPLSRLVAEGIFLTALAPPATPSMILCGAGKDTEPSRVAAALGTLVSLAAIVTLMLTGWSPWRL
jgi:predicted permease